MVDGDLQLIRTVADLAAVQLARPERTASPRSRDAPSAGAGGGAGGLLDTLIVAMSGYGQEEDRRLSRQAGFDAHHVKPIELDALRALIAGRARAQRTPPPGEAAAH